MDFTKVPRHDDAMVTPNPNYRKDLEAAIETVEDYFARMIDGEEVILRRHGKAAPGKFYGPKTAAVIAAARKHLDTLPKPKVTFWRVTGTRGETPLGPYVYLNKERALDVARKKLDEGADAVSVQPFEVDA